MSGSIELATILLTDLVGSTRLATSVGPVRADELRDEHFALLREAIGCCGGREVKNTGDGLMAAFSSASAAVGCAVQMHQMLERRHRRSLQPLHVRIGLGAGESTVKDGDYFGMPSIEAARLCDKAPADGILVSPAVRMLAGRTAGITFESVGELELKGFPGPVEAFSVPWSPLPEEGDAVGGWPLPSALRSVPSLAYVGREQERAQLEAAIAAARAGSRRAVLISGEPGIGKTRLASFAAHGAHSEGFAVCWGACSEDVGAPYEPWLEVCSQLVEHAPGEVVAAHVQRRGGEISRVARNLARRVADAPPPQSSDPETERFLLFSAVAGLLEDVSASVPVCVVLDDFQWADGQSVALLKHLARTLERSALAVLVTYRDSELGKEHPLSGVLADLRRLEGVERIRLGGLEAAEVAQVLAAAAGHELNSDGVGLACQIAEETNGNPFFVGEVLRSMLESGRLLFDETSRRWTIDRSSEIGLPESVREVIEQRVDRLGNEARETLTLAAVIGRSFDLEVLEKVVDVDAGRLLDLLETAVAASLLDESTERFGQFRFVHALINQTLYERLGATRRARMHHRIALALEEVCGADAGERIGELAMHWRLATAAVDRFKAAGYAARAGQRALDSLAPAEAVRLFKDAVELIGSGETSERCRALIGLGEAQRLVGDPAYRETLLEASRIASLLGDIALATAAALENSGGLPSVVGESDDERIAAIERAIELDDGSDPARRARLLGIHAVELGYDRQQVERRRAIAREAVALARAAGDPAALAAVLRDAWQAIWSADTVPEMKQLSDEMRRAAGESGDPALQWWGSEHGYMTHVMLGQLDQASVALEDTEKLAAELGQPRLHWLAAAQRTTWEQLHGHLAAAEEHRERALALGQEAEPLNSALYYGADLAWVRTRQGRGEEVVAMLEGSIAAYPGIPAWRAALASTYGWMGERDKAAAILAEAADDRFEHIPHDPVRMTALVMYADAAAQTGSRPAADYLYELLAPFADQVVYNDAVGYGHVRLYLGALAFAMGRHELAVEHLECACRFHEEHRLLVWAADSHVWLGRTLSRRGDTKAAHEHTQRALQLARENGYASILTTAEMVATDGLQASRSAQVR